MNKAQPDWDIDYAYGRQGELLVLDYLRQIAEGHARKEVKRKTYLDLVFYFETHCNKGNHGIWTESGILTTKAQIWPFVIAETGLVVIYPVEVIRKFLTHPSVRDKMCTEGNYPTKGKLINLAAFVAWLKFQK